jgi:hypothetical protein
MSAAPTPAALTPCANKLDPNRFITFFHPFRRLLGIRRAASKFSVGRIALVQAKLIAHLSFAASPPGWTRSPTMKFLPANRILAKSNCPEFWSIYSTANLVARPAPPQRPIANKYPGK